MCASAIARIRHGRRVSAPQIPPDYPRVDTHGTRLMCRGRQKLLRTARSPELTLLNVIDSSRPFLRRDYPSVSHNCTIGQRAYFAHLRQRSNETGKQEVRADPKSEVNSVLRSYERNSTWWVEFFCRHYYSIIMTDCNNDVQGRKRPKALFLEISEY